MVSSQVKQGIAVFARWFDEVREGRLALHIPGVGYIVHFPQWDEVCGEYYLFFRKMSPDHCVNLSGDGTRIPTPLIEYLIDKNGNIGYNN